MYKAIIAVMILLSLCMMLLYTLYTNLSSHPIPIMILNEENDVVHDPRINQPQFDFLNLPFYRLRDPSKKSNDRKADIIKHVFPITRVCPAIPNFPSNASSICWCIHTGGGSSNLIVQYFAVRGMAYFLDMDFHLFPENGLHGCTIKNPRNILFSKTDDEYSSMSFLPKHSTKHFSDNYNLTVKYELFLQWMNECTTSPFSKTLNLRERHWTYRSCMVLFYYNPIFLPILREESLTSVQTYFHERNVSYNNHSEKYPNIAIHIRCGDVVRGGNEEYGLMLMSYYKQAILKTAQLRFGFDIKSFKQILIFTQLGNNSLRSHYAEKGEIKQKSNCETLIAGYLKAFANEIVPFLAEDIDIKVIGNGDRTIDMHRMSQSSYLICSLSTFCWYAAQMSINPVILPHGGPWKHLGEYWVKGEMWMPSNHFYIYSSNLSIMGNTYGVSGKKTHIQTMQQIVNHITEH